MNASVVVAKSTIADEERAQRYRTLGQFLRQRRERVRPDEVGLAVRRRRRAPGLLREEVAEIAGVSTTWYTWLEQGRPVNPSVRVLGALATALCLTREERGYLLRLARPDLHAASTTSPALTPALRSMLHGLAPHPAYAIDALCNVIAWNADAAEVFGPFAGEDRSNIITRLLFDPDWRALFVEWEEIVERAVAQFRAATVSLASTEAHRSFVAQLCERSDHFARLWSAGDVKPMLSCVKVLNHPSKGRLVYTYATLRPDDAAGDVRFTIYTKDDKQ